MEELNLILLWKEQNQRLDQTITLNERLAKEIISNKAAAVMVQLKQFNIRAIIAAIVYLIFLGVILFYTITHYSKEANYFIVSFTAIFLINIKALTDYIKHLVWADKIDFNDGVIYIQQQLNKLELSLFKHSRIMVLQFPFWTTFFLSSAWFPGNATVGYVIFQLCITSISICLTIWLHKNLTIAHANNKWVKVFIEGAGGKSVYKAMAFFMDMEDFKQPK